MAKKQGTRSPHSLASRLLIVALFGLLLSQPASTAAGHDTVTPALSSLIAISFISDQDTGTTNAADWVKAFVHAYATGALSPSVEFPLANEATDRVRTIPSLQYNVVVSWLNPLTQDDSPDAPLYGANNDYIAYFGDGWQDAGRPLPFSGSGNSGWLWVNHESMGTPIENRPPTATSAPTGQHLSLARSLQARGILTDVSSNRWNDADLSTYLRYAKRQIGGSWLRVVKDAQSGAWRVDHSAPNRRYDATSNTLFTLVGQRLHSPDHDDFNGAVLTDTVVSGTLANCSGVQTPWGTILSAEENAQGFYGDLEQAWTGDNKFIRGTGFDPGEFITPDFVAHPLSVFGGNPDANGLHQRDLYGYLVEVDPGEPPNAFYTSMVDGGAGSGHRKLGGLGRARWEDVTFVVDASGNLIDGQPIVLYASQDRASGRIYKWVSKTPFAQGMSRVQIRALLDEGTLYVAHFQDLDYDTGWTVNGVMPTEDNPGHGRWIELSIASKDIAPNAVALGHPGTTVGEALQDVTWNGIGGFASNEEVRMALFTAANKIGVAELNRPENILWNPTDPSGEPRLYIAFTGHTRQVALNSRGVLFDPDTHAEEAPTRSDRVGSIFVLRENSLGNPANSHTFSYFAVWRGIEGAGLFAAANPDNLMTDMDGGLWFTTDGNRRVNGTDDGLYYLDLDPDHRQGKTGIITSTFGLAFRVVTVPNDSEPTGPAFSSNLKTIFLSLQRPAAIAEKRRIYLPLLGRNP